MSTAINMVSRSLSRISSISTVAFVGIVSISEVHGYSLREDVNDICHWVIYTGLCQTICMFGIVTNTINIICFVKQGFSDAVNVSLLGLTLSDMGCLLVMTVSNIFMTPAFRSSDLPFDAMGLCYLVGGMPHTTLTRVTGWFTALITLERCLCIAMPLKVKLIVTPKRMAMLLMCVFVVLIISAAPVYVVNRAGMQFIPERNKSILVLFYTKDRETVERFSFAVNNVLLPFSFFIMMIVCTIILVVILRRKTAWRKASTSATQMDTVSNRNRKVAKMVVMISSLFIACFVPISITFIGMCICPEFSLTGQYKDLLYIVGGFGFILETINSSVNIFIYYHMSSKYRQIFRQLFKMTSVKFSD